MNINRGNNRSWNNRPPRGGYRGRYNGGRQRNNFSNPNNFRNSWRDNNQRYNSYEDNPNKKYYPRPHRETPGKRLAEDAIGVTEYINDHEGFNGIIKTRYSDFQVSEINENGEIAKLTTETPPELPVTKEIDEDEELVLNKYNLEIIPMDTWDKINKLVVDKEPSNESVDIDVSDLSKEGRTKIHEAVKRAFGDAIVGSTVNLEDKKYIKLTKYRKGVRIDKRVKWPWPGEFVHFIVYKENCDTMEAALKIAEKLRFNFKPSMLGYSGTKDRRGKTSQWFSLKKVLPSKIAAASRDLRGIVLGNYSFQNYHLKLGMLSGNQFRLALRNVTASDEAVVAACALLRDNGFINYYGLQRFGARADAPTFAVGRLLLQGKFKEAIDLILEPRPGPFEQALKAFREQDASAAWAQWPKAISRTSIELRLVKALAHAPNDLLGAMNKLARNTRLLYIHSYQSLIWNKCVSERIKKFGLKPVPGDLVALSDLENDCIDEEALEDEEDNNEEESTEADAETETETETDSSEKRDKKPEIKVKRLTQSDVDGGKFSVFDVVLPLPGFGIEYPSNMKGLYEELLAQDGLTLEMRHKIKSYSMSGAYRLMLVRPSDMSWECVKYDDPNADLIASDLDELNKKTLRGIKDDGQYKALILKFSLPASCYATMALRELLKVDTSCDFQALQNNYHKRKLPEASPAAEATDSTADLSKLAEGDAAGNEEVCSKKAKLDE